LSFYKPFQFIFLTVFCPFIEIPLKSIMGLCRFHYYHGVMSIPLPSWDYVDFITFMGLRYFAVF